LFCDRFRFGVDTQDMSVMVALSRTHKAPLNCKIVV